jgi:cell division protein FtsZ
MKQLGRHVPDQTHILFGLGVDAKLGDAVAITLISSLGLSQLNAHATAAPPSEMLQPRSEAPPEPRREVPVRKAVIPPPPPVFAEPVADLLFKTEEIITSAPAPAAVETAKESAPVEVEEPEFMDEPEPVVAEEPSAPVIEASPETARIPVRTPAAKELADAARSKESTLATVVARSVTLQTESAAPQDDLITFDNTPPPTTTIHATTVVSRKPVGDPQQTFSLGEEDRGRFKDTEPSIVQGEDLDVPTWMRLKKKLRR